MHAALLHLKAHLLRHLVVMSIVLGMLLVPATCANAAGPHSLFMTPTVKHTTSMNHGSHHGQGTHADMDMEMSGMSADEHAMHMEMDGADSNQEPTQVDATPASLPNASQIDAPVEPLDGSVNSLPSSMAMAAVSNPVTIAELDAIQFPSSPRATSPRSAAALAGRVVSLELPPPRLG